MTSTRLTVLLFLLAPCCGGCDSQRDQDKPSKATNAELEAAAKKEAAAERQRAEQLAREQREREAALKRKQEDEAQNSAQVLTRCCDALAKAGFEGRSMAFMASADACRAAVEKERTLEEIAPELRKALEGEKAAEGETLPTACTP